MTYGTRAHRALRVFFIEKNLAKKSSEKYKNSAKIADKKAAETSAARVLQGKFLLFAPAADGECEGNRPENRRNSRRFGNCRKGNGEHFGASRIRPFENRPN